MDLKVTAKECRFMSSGKKLVFTIPICEEDHYPSRPTVELNSEWEITTRQRTYAKKVYTLCIGRIGPHIACAAFYELGSLYEGHWPHAYIPVDGEAKPYALGLGTDPKTVGLPGNWHQVTYKNRECSGNLYSCWMEETLIQQCIDEGNLNWHIVVSPHGSRTLDVMVKKPYEVRRDIYRNAQSPLVYGGNLTWADDDFVGRNRNIHFGAFWPTKEALEDAMDHFVQTGEVQTCSTYNALRTRFPGFIRNKMLGL